MILRPATSDDAAAIGALHHLTMRTSLPFLPDLHTVAEVIAYVGDSMLPGNTVWVAELEGEIAGCVAFTQDWINQLYVHPDRQGQGIGPALLAKALADGRPKQLWAFQQNDRARRFYEARGFAAVEFTDGAGNEEKTPDVRYAWRAGGM
ncbi:GNAT family N-acetyltransferase [Phenylobacterium sp.]|uniref:GNAT family N-acetyltransferase n=1 Tax=Phenylobacterium sp. TaxID=1871053 RepID=UPI0025ECAB14|nr:GNAT family N-acetyltransferase [Phenylobacterium sp.]